MMTEPIAKRRKTVAGNIPTGVQLGDSGADISVCRAHESEEVICFGMVG